jgi:hypothetical protein
LVGGLFELAGFSVGMTRMCYPETPVNLIFPKIGGGLLYYFSNNMKSIYSDKRKCIRCCLYLFFRAGRRLGKKTFTIKAPGGNNMESWVNKTYRYAFIDYRKYNETHSGTHERFSQRGWRYRDTNREWNRVFDGVFFIREMAACSAGTAAAGSAR